VKRCFAQAAQKHGIIPMAAKTLEQAGFEVPFLKVKPVYSMYEMMPSIIGFSKTMMTVLIRNPPLRY
jgi:hypothetical protein